MGISFIEFSRQTPITDMPVDYGLHMNCYDNPWAKQAVQHAAEKHQTVDEHPFVEKVREAIQEYRLQSAAHFDIHVHVHVKHIIQAKSTLDAARDPSFRIKIEFGNFNRPLPRICRPKFRKHPRTKLFKPTNKVEVIDNGRAVSLNRFLSQHFPAFEDVIVSAKSMQAWWGANGRQFDWNGLPTELKELVVQFCLHAPHGQDRYRQLLKRYKGHFARQPEKDREFGIYEIVDQLGNWASLLGVSHQVRAIALRLCLVGGSNLLHSKGFCLVASSYEKLDDALRRLGRYYQMIEPSSLPMNDKTQVLARCYKQYPKIYWHLQQYATFSHGLRKVCLYMNFMSSMCFFKVTVGGFQRYWYSDRMTYEIFQQLPQIKEIEIRLPLQPHQGWKDLPDQRRPRLFYDDQACPRVLHRAIYEEIAQALAPYSCVRVKNFGDDEEQARFHSLRKEARAKLKFTRADFEELYAECGGGIQLEEPVEQEVWDVGAYQQRPIFHNVDDNVENFFPPKCRCETRCNLVYQKREAHQRRIWG